jgi:TolB-like protein/DNA-binding winged helix-turn-helix (wHTH) protein/Flp pilus assembly protein TadD
MDVSVKDRGVYAFGPFRLDPVRRTLTRDGVPVKLAARLFETLLYLIEAQGRLVEKDELLAAVWPGRIVEEANLSQAISGLRKALSQEGTEEAFIVTVPGRGYRFAAPVRTESGAPAPGAEPAAISHAAPSPPATPAPEGQSAEPLSWWRKHTFAVAACVTLAAIGAITVAQRFPQRGNALTKTAFAPPPHSVAVLPFANMSGDAGEEYFSDGLAEELIDTLSTIDAIHVAARVSAFSFKGSQATIADIAEKLNVGTVLEGSVRRDATHVRIAAQLIDARSGFTLWSRTYNRDRQQGDILQVQADIAGAVASALAVKLLDADSEKLVRGGTHNPRAFDAYLRAMANNSPVADEARARQSFDDFTAAIAIDPGYAAAYAGRAAIGNVLASLAGGPADVTAKRKMLADAMADADRAIAIEPSLADAHWARALLLRSSLDFTGASAELARARELAPGNAVIESIFGYCETITGNTDVGVAALRHAVALDPLRASVYRNLASALTYARRYDEALEAFRYYEKINSHPSHAEQMILGIIYLAKGDAAAAVPIFTGHDGFYDNEYLAIADHALGRQNEAEQHLARAQQQDGDAGAYNYVAVYAQWGQQDQALHWLQTALALRDPGLNELRTDPFLDPIRATPQFHDIERQLHFPP